MEFFDNFLLLIPFLLLNLIIFLFFDRIKNFINLYDKPNEIRKIHSEPVANIGGIFFLINLVLILFLDLFTLAWNIESPFFNSNNDYLSFYIGSFIFFLIGLYDDNYEIKSSTKLILFTITVLGLVIIDSDILLKYLKLSFLDQLIYLRDFSAYFTIICFLLYMNAFNMLDGINLQAGIYFNFILLILILSKSMLFIPLVLIICSVVFLYLNSINKIFLGNSGSNLISFIICIFMIKSYNYEYLEVEQIFLIMMIPGLDMLRLFILRIYRGKSPFLADDNHLHHLLLRKFSYKKTILSVQILIIMPYLLSYLINSYIYGIIIGILLYLSIILSTAKFSK